MMPWKLNLSEPSYNAMSMESSWINNKKYYLYPNNIDNGRINVIRNPLSCKSWKSTSGKLHYAYAFHLPHKEHA